MKIGDKIIQIPVGVTYKYPCGIYKINYIDKERFRSDADPFSGFYLDNSLNYACRYYPVGKALTYLWEKNETIK